jgi:hypothetical protein
VFRSHQTPQFLPTPSIHFTYFVSIRIVCTKYCTLTVNPSHATIPRVLVAQTAPCALPASFPPAGLLPHQPPPRLSAILLRSQPHSPQSFAHTFRHHRGGGTLLHSEARRAARTHSRFLFCTISFPFTLFQTLCALQDLISHVFNTFRTLCPNTGDGVSGMITLTSRSEIRPSRLIHAMFTIRGLESPRSLL